MNDSPIPLPEGAAVAWGLRSAGTRGRRPRYSLGEVVAAAVALADHAGLESVSMPRLAARLQITQNGLYRYVASKAELLALMGDAVAEPLPLPDPDADWSSNARAWTVAAFNRYAAHPWLLDLPMQPPMLPNALTWLECFLEGIENSGLDLLQRVQCARLLDGHARAVAALSRDLPSDQPSYPAEAVAAFEPLLLSRGLQRTAQVFRMAATDGAPASDGVSPELEFGVERILDGMRTLTQQK